MVRYKNGQRSHKCILLMRIYWKITVQIFSINIFFLLRMSYSYKVLIIYRVLTSIFLLHSASYISKTSCPFWFKPFSTLRTGLSHLQVQKFRHILNDTNPSGTCRLDSESIDNALFQHNFPDTLIHYVFVELILLNL